MSPNVHESGRRGDGDKAALKTQARVQLGLVVCLRGHNKWLNNAGKGKSGALHVTQSCFDPSAWDIAGLWLLNWKRSPESPV